MGARDHSGTRDAGVPDLFPAYTTLIAARTTLRACATSHFIPLNPGESRPKFRGLYRIVPKGGCRALTRGVSFRVYRGPRVCKDGHRHHISTIERT